MTAEQILTRLLIFIKRAIIVGGYGTEYKECLYQIMEGAEPLEVLEKYNKIIGVK